MRSPCLSSGVAGSKRRAIREGDLPPTEVLKTLGFVASLQKVVKESGDLKEELDFTLCTNITRSFYISLLTYLWPCAPPCGLAHTFHHLKYMYFLQCCATSGILSSLLYTPACNHVLEDLHVHILKHFVKSFTPHMRVLTNFVLVSDMGQAFNKKLKH